MQKYYVGNMKEYVENMWLWELEKRSTKRSEALFRLISSWEIHHKNKKIKVDRR